MRCFTINTEVLSYLQVETDPFSHVPVGEPGRGRTLTRVPLGPQFADQVPSLGGGKAIERASVIRTREKGTLLLVEEKGPDDRALVVLGIPAGFRGGTEIEWSEGCQVIARGYCAQGDAGRMGGHEEALVILSAGAHMRVTRTGRLYGAPPVLHVLWDGENLKFGAEDEVFQPTDGDALDGDLL